MMVRKISKLLFRIRLLKFKMTTVWRIKFQLIVFYFLRVRWLKIRQARIRWKISRTLKRYDFKSESPLDL